MVDHELTPALVTAICTGIATLIASITSLIVSLRTNHIVKIDTAVKNMKINALHELIKSRLKQQ